VDQEHNSWLTGSYRRCTVGRPVEDVDIILISDLDQVSRGRNPGHAAADYSEWLKKLREASHAADQGADVLWVDAETGRTLVAQAKSSEGVHRRKGTEHPPARGVRTYVPADSPAEVHTQGAAPDESGFVQVEPFSEGDAPGYSKSDTFPMALLAQAPGRVSRRRRIEPVEALNILRRLMQMVRKTKRVLGRLLSPLSYRPFLRKVIAVRLMHMHRGEDDPDALLRLRRHPWTAGRPAVV
jgi:hypothetical protein